MISHKKKFGIYHWDTFDNKTILVDEANTEDEAVEKIKKKYTERISKDGADQVDIVDRDGNIIFKYKVK